MTLKMTDIEKQCAELMSRGGDDYALASKYLNFLEMHKRATKTGYIQFGPPDAIISRDDALTRKAFDIINSCLYDILGELANEIEKRANPQ